uniref:MBD domain-containing protein n=1 Tax=Cuerna arida TaxID=1464854 RepID=A0A1B6FS79_9HEMI
MKTNHRSATKKVFEKNERVIAVWAYNHKYPATIRDVLPNDKYEVLFCDGYAKILRGCKLFKATEEDLKNCQLPPPKKPAPPMGADPIDPDLGPKEERRLKKRRMDVLEAFRPHKRQKTDGNQLTPESSPQPSTSTFTPSLSLKSKETPKIVLKGRGRPPSKLREQREREEERQEEDYDEDSGGEGPAAVDTPRPESEAKLRKTRRKKRLFDESTYIYRGPKQRPGMEEDQERWNVEIPEGAAPVQIKDQEGYYRESVIIPDKKMLPGWTKHTMRRKSGAKWDVFLVNPEGRKFRSRNELRNYFAELKQPFPEDSFDFMVGRKLEMIRTQGDGKRRLDSSAVDGEGQSQVDKKSGDFTPDYRRIRTLLPKGRLLEGEEGKSDQSPGSPATPTLTSPPFPLTELRTPDGGFTCCGKTFRKENLFQMHMKHYHPEYSTLFGSTPNVADLAYARTVGEPLEDSRAEAMAPRNTLLERVTRYEAERKASETATASSGGKILPSKEPAPVTPPVTEEPVTTSLLEKTEDTPAASPVVEEAVVDSPTAGEEMENNGDEIMEEVAAPAEVVTPQPPPVEEKAKSTVEVKEDSENTASEVDSPVPPPTTPLPVTTTPSVPIIRPVSKQTTQVPKTTASTEPTSQVPPTSTQKSHPTPAVKTPITITKYVPPGQKPAVSSLTKLTISMTNPTPDKEVKPTIKTLLPMRPPPQEAKEAQEAPKLKEVMVKEESEEETPVRIKPRKRTVSEPFPKKPKLVKHPTGSLEEEPALDEEVQPSHTVVNPSYRFSRNRSQVRVSLEKLVINPDSNGESTVSSEPLADNEAQDAVYENLRKEEIINCTCGYMEEDGLMIQCDLCLCWQHGLCNDIDKESDVPEKYVCHICLNPARERPSTRFLHNQDWLKEGKLPSLSICQKNKDAEVQRETMLKKSHDLGASLLELQTVIRSLRVKTHIATKSDHPKLYLWAKSWKNENAEVKTGNEEDNCKQEVSGPQPEAAIDETECRLRLLEHVEDYQHQVDDRLTSIQAQIAALESEDPDLASDEASDHCPATKQTVQMILHDLCTVRRVATLK